MVMAIYDVWKKDTKNLRLDQCNSPPLQSAIDTVEAPW
jgi:hypothetical protein